jgi:hypothetical protein
VEVKEAAAGEREKAQVEEAAYTASFEYPLSWPEVLYSVAAK